MVGCAVGRIGDWTEEYRMVVVCLNACRVRFRSAREILSCNSWTDTIVRGKCV